MSDRRRPGAASETASDPAAGASEDPREGLIAEGQPAPPGSGLAVGDRDGMAPGEPDGEDAESVDADDELDGAARHQWTVEAEHVDARLDVYLATRLGAPRTLAQRLIEAELVSVAGKPPKKAGQRLRFGEVVLALVPRPVPLQVAAEDLPLSILYEDAQLVVVDKAAGMVVHPAAGHHHGTLVNALLFHCRDLSGIGGVARPGIVHRLDKDTSGAMVVSKDDVTHAYLAAELARKSAGGASSIRREYLAIACPAPREDRGTYRTLYGRHPVHRQRFSSKVSRGKSAVTHWQVVERFAGAALVSLRLETGRTHQIRVHAADHGWPLLADPVYGHRPAEPRLAQLAAELGRQALHAQLLAFVHPRTGQELVLQSPLPADLARVLAGLR